MDVLAKGGILGEDEEDDEQHVELAGGPVCA